MKTYQEAIEEIRFKPDEFIVINRKNLKKLSTCGKDSLDFALNQICNNNKYYVCNQDEPYADKVLQVILEGEKSKKDHAGYLDEFVASKDDKKTEWLPLSDMSGLGKEYWILDESNNIGVGFLANKDKIVYIQNRTPLNFGTPVMCAIVKPPAING